MTRRRRPRPRGERTRSRTAKPAATKDASGPTQRPATAGPAGATAKGPRRTPQPDRTTDRSAQRPAAASPAPRPRSRHTGSSPVLPASSGTTVIGVPTEASPGGGPGANAVADAPARSRTARPARAPRTAAGRGQRGRARTAEEAFDRLYAGSAGALLRQVELLTGDGEFARRAVAHAFDVTWQRWPEVARDADPVGWVRAAGHDFALAPWQRWMPARRRPHPRTPGEPLAAALLELPPPQRRAVLLHDGLGLDVLAAATEVEATVPGAAARIAHAREELTATVDGLGPDTLPERLSALLAVDREPPEHPRQVRDASERGTRRRTLAALALTAVIALATTVALQVGPADRAAPPPRGTVPARTAHPAAAHPAPVSSRPHGAEAR